MFSAILSGFKALSLAQKALVLVGIAGLLGGLYISGRMGGAAAERDRQAAAVTEDLIKRDKANAVRVDDLLTALENKGKSDREAEAAERALFLRLASNTEARLSDAIKTLPTDDSTCDVARSVGVGMRDAAVEANTAVRSREDD